MRRLWLLLACACAPTPSAPSSPPLSRVEQELAQNGETTVIVTLRDPSGLPRDPLDPGRIAMIELRAAGFAASVESSHARVRTFFRTFPGAVVRVDAQGYQALRAHPDVAAIDPDLPVSAHLPQSVPLIRGDLAQAAGHDGAGVAVAVLDTGVRPTHEDLAAAVLGSGYHSLDQGANQGVGGAVDDQGHGTNVAGIVASRGIRSGKGVAPAARIVAVKVLDSQNRGWSSDWVAGVDWAVANRDAFAAPIRVINMSLGTDARTGSCPCDAEQAAMEAAMGAARGAGMLVVVSSGNQGDTTSLPYPACFSAVIAVGATYDSAFGQSPATGTYQSQFGAGWPACSDATAARGLTCFSNRNGCLKLVAPGAPITSDGRNTDQATSTFYGTSQAAPHVAGAAAALWGSFPSLTVEEVHQALLNSSTSVTDPVLTQTYAFLDVMDAVASAECETGCTPQNNCELAACNGQNQCEHTLMAPGTLCGASTCAQGMRTAPKCSATGACEPTMTSCGVYRCNTIGTECLVSCQSNDDCADGNECDGTTCKEASGCQAAPGGAPPLTALAVVLLFFLIRRRRWTQ